MIALTGLVLCAPAMAQNLFAPVIKVNDAVITEYEIQQRVRFLQVLNAPGATRDCVAEALIDERLRAQAVADAGLELTPEGIEESLTEFAGRAELTKDEFIAALAGAGVAEESFRDFVINGIGWRELIRARFGARVEISEAEIDRALSATGGTSGIRVLVSEIIIPSPPERAAEVQSIAERISATTSEARVFRLCPPVLRHRVARRWWASAVASRSPILPPSSASGAAGAGARRCHGPAAHPQCGGAVSVARHRGNRCSACRNTAQSNMPPITFPAGAARGHTGPSRADRGRALTVAMTSTELPRASPKSFWNVAATHCPRRYSAPTLRSSLSQAGCR